MKDKRGGTGRGEAGAGEVAKEAPLMEAEKTYFLLLHSSRAALCRRVMAASRREPYFKINGRTWAHCTRRAVVATLSLFSVKEANK